MRAETLHEEAGLRYRVVEELRVRFPAKPIRRERLPLNRADPDALLVRLEGDHAAMAERVLREGARGWKRWSTLRRRAGSHFSPLVVEVELLDHLCRESGLHVEDRWRNGRWVADRFRVDESIWPWLGILDPELVRAELEAELSRPEFLAALAEGPPAGFGWAGFAFVLRAAERAVELEEHGLLPGERELAGLVDHTKAWTPRRRELFERLTGRGFYELVARKDRPIEIHGPVRHEVGGLYAASLPATQIEVLADARGVILVENRETYRRFLPLGEAGWIVLNVPGGPPPAETELIERLRALAPELPFHACFDLDPAGIRIALLVQERAGVELIPTGMSAALLDAATSTHALNDWDLEVLRLLRGRAGLFEPLRAAIEARGEKVEQEIFQRHLIELFEAGPVLRT